MELNGIRLYDAPHPALLTPLIKREIVNYVDIFKTQKLSIHQPADLIGCFSDYRFIKISAKESCGGYCDFENKIIALNDNQNSPIATIFHELGHAIQAKLGLMRFDCSLSHKVKEEQQAETIAYNLYAALVNKNIYHKLFNVYFNIEDIKWLNEYYEGYFENDLSV